MHAPTTRTAAPACPPLHCMRMCVGMRGMRTARSRASAAPRLLARTHTLAPHPAPLLAAKLLIVCNNIPPVRKSELEYYAMLAKTGVHHYSGNNVDLGTACGRYFRVSVMAITDAGDSDIIKALPDA